MIYIINNTEIEAVNIKVARSKYKKKYGVQCYHGKPKDISKPKLKETSNFDELYEIQRLMKKQGLI